MSPGGLSLAPRILAAAAQFYGIGVDAVCTPRRFDFPKRVRHVAMFLMRDLTPASYTEIARRVGRANHTTALHGVREMRRRSMVEAPLARELAALRAMLES